MEGMRLHDALTATREPAKVADGGIPKPAVDASESFESTGVSEILHVA